MNPAQRFRALAELESEDSVLDAKKLTLLNVEQAWESPVKLRRATEKVVSLLALQVDHIYQDLLKDLLVRILSH